MAIVPFVFYCSVFVVADSHWLCSVMHVPPGKQSKLIKMLKKKIDRKWLLSERRLSCVIQEPTFSLSLRIHHLLGNTSKGVTKSYPIGMLSKTGV